MKFLILTPRCAHSLAEQNHAKQGGFPQHALDFNFEMGPPNLRSVSCLLNGQCLPLGGQSVWGTMGPPGTKKIVLAAARLDSVALFHDRAYGGQAEASDIVTLLAVVDALSKVDTSSLPLAIGFGLFQGENWGQIGSRRFVTEVANFTCTVSSHAHSRLWCHCLLTLAHIARLQSLQPAATSATGKAFCRQPLRTDLTFANLTGSSFHQVIAIDQVRHRVHYACCRRSYQVCVDECVPCRVESQPQTRTCTRYIHFTNQPPAWPPMWLSAHPRLLLPIR